MVIGEVKGFEGRALSLEVTAKEKEADEVC